MPLYEDRKNAENIINIADEYYNNIITENNAVYAEIIKAIKEKAANLKRPAVAAFEGWYGVEWVTKLLRKNYTKVCKYA